MVELKKKEFTFRGKKMEELKELDVREFAKLLTARSRRTILRNFQELENFVTRAQAKAEKGKPTRTHHRDLVIVPGLVGLKIQVYNGQKFLPIEVVGEMLGHKFGEFAPTRGRINHGKAGVGATKGSRAQAKH
tara:strand:- start:277 stop:675 length:399 start_codon:yes stop_codon:yes gene_type:complete